MLTSGDSGSGGGTSSGGGKKSLFSQRSMDQRELQVCV